MARPTRVCIDKLSLLHNLNQVKKYAPFSKIIAMVKANAYGCGLSAVVPVLDHQVYAFGVACIEEALIIRKLGGTTDCILFQGIFSADELPVVAQNGFQCVLHHPEQLAWLLATPLVSKIKVWVKVDTGMHRLGFAPELVYNTLTALQRCTWVDQSIGLITHLACADEPNHQANQAQIQCFEQLNLPLMPLIKTMANSAAIMSRPSCHVDMVRPGLMLYGVSPFALQKGYDLGLMPVMRFISAISAIQQYPSGANIGYGAVWKTSRPSRIGIIPVGYGDGYPRHIVENTPVWINHQTAPIVGRISMDMLSVDLTDHPLVSIGDEVELWGQYIPVETIAIAAKTSVYELLCQISPRVRKDNSSMI